MPTVPVGYFLSRAIRLNCSVTTGAPVVGVLPLRLHDDERHVRGVGLLLVEVLDPALADEHVADLDRAVVLELLLAVEHERALGEELAHHLVHRVLPAGRVGRLVLGERAPERHRERERRRRGDVLEARVACRRRRRGRPGSCPARAAANVLTGPRSTVTFQAPVGFPMTLVSTAMWRCSPGAFVLAAS